MTTKERLVEKVEAAFGKLRIHAEHLGTTFPEGFWKQADCYRWEATYRLSFPDGRSPIRAMVNSWDTATECVKKGDIKIDEDGACHYIIHAPSSLIK